MRRPRFWIGLAAVAAIAIGSVAVAAIVYSGDRADFDEMQREEAARAARHAESLAGLSVGELATATAFFQAENKLSRHAFEAVGRTLLRQGALRGTALVRVVTAARRSRFERAFGVPIFELGPGGKRPAADRPVYYPVTYAASKRSPTKVLGYDLASDPLRSPYLRRARDTGMAVATPVIPLVLGGAGINIYRPIYRDGAATATVAQRRRALRGFATGSFRIGDLAAAASESLPEEDEMQLLAEDEVVLGPTGELEGGASAPIQIADRTWTLVVRSPSAPGLGLPFLVAGVGIALACLLASLILAWSSSERMHELERQASQDSLTGLHNRRRFEEQLRAAIGRARREGTTGALLIIDLDHFKHVNDTHGHPVGDQVIQEIAEVLRRRTRASDSLSRLGGDEFAIVLSSCGREEAIAAAQSIADAIRELQPRSRADQVTASVGVTLFGDGFATRPASVLSEADAAMYAAKEGGRDGVRSFDHAALRENAREE